MAFVSSSTAATEIITQTSTNQPTRRGFLSFMGKNKVNKQEDTTCKKITKKKTCSSGAPGGTKTQTATNVGSSSSKDIDEQNPRSLFSWNDNNDSYSCLLESLADIVLSMMMNPMTIPTSTTTSTNKISSSSSSTQKCNRRPEESFHDHSTSNTMSTSLSSTISSTRTMSTTSSMSSSSSSLWTRKDILCFLKSFPVRYSLNIQQNPKDIVLHMTLLEDVKLNGGLHYASVHVSSDIPPTYFTSFNIMEGSNNNTNQFKYNRRPSQQQQQQHVAAETQLIKDHNIKAITIVSPQTSGLLEFIMSLWEASGCDILDCNILLSKESMLLIQAIIRIKGGFKLDQLQDQINSFLRVCTGFPPLSSFQGLPISTRFGSPDPTRVTTHVHPYHQRDKVIIDGHNVGYELFDPYDFTNDDCTAVLHSDCPDQATRIRVQDSYLKTPTLLYDLISLREHLSDKRHNESNNPNGHGHSHFSRVEKKSESMEHGSNHSVSLMGGNSDHSVGGRRKLVSRSASIDLDQSVSSSTKFVHRSFFSNTVDPLPRIMITATIKESLPNAVFQGYLIKGEDTFLESFQNDKALFEHQTGLLAIKVAYVTKDIDCAKNLEGLCHEGDIAKSLDHINVCKLVTQYRSPQMVLLAYEYCSKGSLCSLICDDTKTYDYLPLALDIAQGMAYLHSKNIIHRDLKPSNIFVDKDTRAKVADFGMCTVHNGDGLKGETGTYRWMAPEVIRHEPYSTKADVYSFGICLWQLVTRSSQPFSDMNPIQAAYAVTKGERPFIPYETPDFIRQIITACWDDDHLKRPTFVNIYLGLSAYSNISCPQDYCI